MARASRRDGDVRGLAERLSLAAGAEDLREATRAALVAVARERYSWDGVARRRDRRGAGPLDDLPSPDGPSVRTSG